MCKFGNLMSFGSATDHVTVVQQKSHDSIVQVKSPCAVLIYIDPFDKEITVIHVYITGNF